MDISLNRTNKGSIINVKSIHGMLWLQTHFENNWWSALAKNEVKVCSEDAKNLLKDAQEAGLILKIIPILSSPLRSYKQK